MHPTSSFLGQPNESRRTNVPAVSVKRDTNWIQDRGVIPDNAKSHVNRSEPKTGGGRACFLCGSHFHLKANCDRKPSTVSIKRVHQTSAQPYHPTADSAGQRLIATASANVNTVEVENSDFSFDSALGDILVRERSALRDPYSQTKLWLCQFVSLSVRIFFKMLLLRHFLSD